MEWLLESRAVSTVVSALNFLILFFVVPLTRHVRKMRTNELSHIEGKIDRAIESLERLEQGQAKHEKRWEDHITFHLQRTQDG